MFYIFGPFSDDLTCRLVAFQLGAIGLGAKRLGSEQGVWEVAAHRWLTPTAPQIFVTFFAPGVKFSSTKPLGKSRKVDSPQKKSGKASGWAPEIRPKHRKSLPNGRQQGGAFGAAPRRRRFAPPPWGSCRFPFGKDFLCLGLISGAHPEAFPLFFWDCPPSSVFPLLIL